MQRSKRAVCTIAHASRCRDEKLIATFLANVRVFWKPSPNRLISAIMLLSGTIIEIGRNMDFKLSGSSVRPA